MAPRTASDKQLHWVGKCLADKDLSAPAWGTAYAPDYTLGKFVSEVYGKWVNVAEGTVSEDLPADEARHLLDTLFSAKPKPVPESELAGAFFSELGTRLNLRVTVTSVQVEFDYRRIKGTPEGSSDVLYWYDNSYDGQYAEGETCTVRATIKSHKVFKGERQTYINRVKKV